MKKIGPTKPTVIGIYGIPASGKSYMLAALRKELGQTEFAFFEGSEVIDSLVPGGLDAFQRLDESEKTKWRAKAINHIKHETATSGRIAIVTGHLMFWSTEDAAPYAVYTPEDLETFTHIIYMCSITWVIMWRLENDNQRDRSSLTTLTEMNWLDWHSLEVTTLRNLCRQHKILFTKVEHPEVKNVKRLVQHFQKFATPEANIAQVTARLDRVLARSGTEELQTFLVFDGDRTLSAEDGGRLFLDALEEHGVGLWPGSHMKNLYSGPMGYSDEAFHQATLLFEEDSSADHNFKKISDMVAPSVPLHPELLSLLRLVAESKHIGAVVVTCGVGRVWTKILKNLGLSGRVKVIGGGRFSDGYFVTPGVKAAVVSHLRDVYDLHVWAFGDSPLDIPMLLEADEAIVVVGDEKKRSSTMDVALAKSIQDDYLRARQILLPSQSSPRLDEDRLPVVSLADQNFFNSIVDPRPDRRPLKIFHATNKAAAKVLMSTMRDATVAGPLLRDAHANVGHYLAVEYVSKLIGLEEYTIPHVQGHETTAHRLRNEAGTCIVALMRGGEPMAFGVNQVFPQAMFIHAGGAADIKKHHIQDKSTVILVDSVINSGKSIIEFIKRVVRLEPSISILVVAGVVQAEAVAETHLLSKVMRRYEAGLVALRLSENKFTGTKTTDTGNRLFNTTHLA
ncbi:hypothetical protein IL306_013363 [Fusarium sp. DS 682]|nr:hypothetical protein IL306_013363 [Fusarium sp. DS 682]